VTLLEVQRRDGRLVRCAWACHHAKTRQCHCCCRGLYHGLGEGTTSFARAVAQHHEWLLLDLGQAEARGELWILAYRPSLSEPLIFRRHGVPRAYQEALLP